MELSSDLISQFVKITNDKTEDKKETTVYGTIIDIKDKIYVQLDGAEEPTPVSTTADVLPGERVTVMIKNHAATITGNLSSPAARTDEVRQLVIDADNASRVATNFLSFSTDGLQVGNKINGYWEGFRTQITGSEFNILDADGNLLASYGSKHIDLGIDGPDAVIFLCSGQGVIEYVTDEDSETEYLQMSADRIRIKGNETASLYATYTDDNLRYEKSAVNVYSNMINMYASECIDPGASDNLESWNSSGIDIYADSIHMDAPEVLDNFGQFESVVYGSSGIWNYKQWLNGDIELWGSYDIVDMACETALGGMYRTDVFSPDAFPFEVYNPNLVASYESDGYGAMLWATTATTSSNPPNYYLVRPTSATIANGKINFHVRGRWTI